MTGQKIRSSFRDPGGSVYHRNGEIYRQINFVYKDDYDYFISSGLYRKLAKLQLIIPHTEIKTNNRQAYKTIKPDRIPFISYPYEWCFSQLKDAALATLAIQKIALDFGMTLKDASACNIQFYRGKPLLIDTSSFKKCDESRPWVAYRQFCMHFLAPLLLMAYSHPQLNKLLRVYIDGIPLELTSALLPIRSWLKPSILAHIHIHAKMENHLRQKKVKAGKNILGKSALLGLVDNLENIITGLSLNLKKSEWSNYYKDNSYTPHAFNYKKKIVSGFLRLTRSNTVWDLGSNTGIFSRIAVGLGAYTISVDSDPLTVEDNYLHCKKDATANCLPLVLDITNPSPGLGWENEERMSLYERGPADTVLALALIHHLVIGKNIAFEKFGSFLSRICKNLIIEFVPKDDSQTQILLQNRTDIFKDYSQSTFEAVFNNFFVIKTVKKIPGSKRVLYLMKKKKE